MGLARVCPSSPFPLLIRPRSVDDPWRAKVWSSELIRILSPWCKVRVLCIALNVLDFFRVAFWVCLVYQV